LLPQDLGRPFSHTTYRFENVDFDQMLDQVEQSGDAIEREIQVGDQDYFLTLLPYKTTVKDSSG